MSKSIEGPFRVYVGLVPQGYLNNEALGQVVREGLGFCQLNEKIRGKVVIRPDLAGADDLAPHAYTNPALIREILYLVTHSPKIRSKAVVLAQAHGILSTQASLLQAHGGLSQFRSRGYYQLESIFPNAMIETIEESSPLRFLLSKGSLLSPEERSSAKTSDSRKRFWPEVITSRHFFEADCLIYAPKIRTSLYGDGFGGAIKLGGMGNLSRPQLLEGIELHNDRRMVDMLEVANPDVIISDGIVVPHGGNELTSRGQELGVVLVANNAVAHDMIAARLMNLNPAEISHIAMAQERGWGPNDMRRIQLGGAGAQGIEMLRQKTTLWPGYKSDLKGFLDKFSADNEGAQLPLEVIEGARYERTGVHGAFLSWLYLNYDIPARRARMARWPKLSVVLGATTQSPKFRRVFVIGNKAIHSFRKQISSVKLHLVRDSREVMFVQLRNGRYHLVFLQHGNPPTERDLSILFFAGTLMRMRTGLLRISLFHRRYKGVGFSTDTGRPVFQGKPIPAVKTTEMTKNNWWI